MGQHLLYPGNVADGTLAAPLTAGTTTTFAVTGWPASLGGAGQPFVVEVGPGLGDDEKILCVSVNSGTVTIASGGRGWDGTNALAHSTGEVCRIVFDAASAQDFSDHIYLTSRDDHTQYFNGTRHQSASHSFVSHGTLANLGNDDHPQYLTSARLGTALGSTAPSPVVARAGLVGGAGLLIGQVVFRAGGMALSGAEAAFLLACDGSAVSRTTYSVLFGKIGTTYGAGDGSTTFNVPDLRGTVAVGATTQTSGSGVPTATGSTNTATRTGFPEGYATGEVSHSLSIGELAAHAHSVTDSGHNHGNTSTEGAVHSHHENSAYSPASVSLQAGSSTYNFFYANNSVATDGETPYHVHGTSNASAAVTESSVGSGTAHNNVQPSLGIPAFICFA